MKILLVCSAGMSTSLLVTKMEQAAKAKGIQVTIWAVAGDEAKENLAKADVLLLGPQVRYLASEMKKLAEPKGIPVDTINPVHYGLMNGEAVLEMALNLKK